MRRRVCALSTALVVFTGCASVDADPEQVPLCGAVASLPPLAEAGSCGEPELGDYAAAVSERLVARMGGALVRVAFDEAGRAESVCVEAANPSDAWRERRHLAAHPDAIAKLPPGPACLAGRRLDVNRYDAAIANLAYFASLCRGQAVDFDGCLERHGKWIVRDRIGWGRPFVFVAPEVPDPPELDATDTVRHCWRKANRRFEPQAECIQAAGWEMLAPPAR
jgi:hypothetical protein